MILSNFGEVIEQASLETYNTYGIKTTAKYLIKVKDIDNLIKLMNYIKDNNLKYYILGKGSNVILPDTAFDGIIISLEKLDKIEVDNNTVVAECGVILSKFVMDMINRNLSGLETLATIPGTLGGALIGNAGFAKDHTIYDNLESIKALRNGKLINVNKEDIEIKHRYTSFKEGNDILVSATFKLNNGNKENMLEIVKNNRQKRIDTQPTHYKNAGSVFRNPEGYSAGKLIDDAHLKGFNVGDAYVSECHANFIVNKGNATSKDIKDLINIIKDKIKEIYNIELELEQVIVDWD